MNKLINEYNNFNEQGQIITLNFLRKYVKELTSLYHANSYIKKIEKSIFFFDYQASYDFDNKVLSLYFNEIKRIVQQKLSEKYDDSNLDHIAIFNAEVLKCISHEGYHAVQYKITDSVKKTLASEILSDSISIYSYRPDLYNTYYDYIPIEVNADIMGLLYYTDFINQLLTEEDVINNNRYVASTILEYYKNDDSYISPTQYFYKMIGEEKRYNKLTKNASVSNYQRMILGLVLDDYYLDKLENISDGSYDVRDIKTYLKNK